MDAGAALNGDPPGSGRLRVGEHCVDPALDVVSRAGVATKVEPRTMRLLLYLVGRRGEPAGVNELLDAVWPDVAVTPDSVYQSIAILRRAFGDDARDPLYIASVPRRGYRLLAEVAPWDEPLAPRPEPASVADAVPADTAAAGSASPVPPFAAPTAPAGWVRAGPGLAAVVLAALALALAAYGVRAGWFGPRGPARPAEASIAVLPFTDQSPGHDQAFFADGLTEEFINLLARVPGLKVPARTSSFYFKGRGASIAEIGRTLGVAYVLEGSARRVGDAVAVTVELVRVADGSQVWSQRYERQLSNIFAVEDQIAGSVVHSLTDRFLPAALRVARADANPEAYTQQLLARHLRWNAAKGDTGQAVAILQRVIGLDPGNAEAWAELASGYVFLSQSADAQPDESMRLARAAAQRSLLLDPSNALAHEALGEVRLSYDFDVPGAVADFEAARHIDPSTPSGDWLRLYSGCVAGPCFEQFIGELSAQIDRDPLNAAAYAKRAFVRFYGGDLSGAERDYRRTFELSPELTSGHFMLACVLMARHRPGEALEVAAREQDNYWRRTAFALAYHALGRRAEADRALAELVRRDASGSAYQIAEVYAVRGEPQRAFEWLERAVQQRDSGLTLVKVDPLLVSLRRDPRLQALVLRLHLQG